MSKRYVVVGGVAGGASAAARIRRIEEKADIQIYDKGPDVSFSNCCLPNHLSGEVKHSDDLVLYDPVTFKKTFNLDAKVNHEVVKILADEHKVVVRNVKTGEEFQDSYDYLNLSPGAEAIRPASIKNNTPKIGFCIKKVKESRDTAPFLETQEVH